MDIRIDTVFSLSFSKDQKILSKRRKTRAQSPITSNGFLMLDKDCRVELERIDLGNKQSVSYKEWLKNKLPNKIVRKRGAEKEETSNGGKRRKRDEKIEEEEKEESAMEVEPRVIRSRAIKDNVTKSADNIGQSAISDQEKQEQASQPVEQNIEFSDDVIQNIKTEPPAEIAENKTQMLNSKVKTEKEDETLKEIMNVLAKAPKENRASYLQQLSSMIEENDLKQKSQSRDLTMLKDEVKLCTAKDIKKESEVDQHKTIPKLIQGKTDTSNLSIVTNESTIKPNVEKISTDGKVDEVENVKGHFLTFPDGKVIFVPMLDRQITPVTLPRINKKQAKNEMTQESKKIDNKKHELAKQSEKKFNVPKELPKSEVISPSAPIVQPQANTSSGKQQVLLPIKVDSGQTRKIILPISLNGMVQNVLFNVLPNGSLSIATVSQDTGTKTTETPLQTQAAVPIVNIGKNELQFPALQNLIKLPNNTEIELPKPNPKTSLGNPTVPMLNPYLSQSNLNPQQAAQNIPKQTTPLGNCVAMGQNLVDLAIPNGVKYMVPLQNLLLSQFLSQKPNTGSDLQNMPIINNRPIDNIVSSITNQTQQTKHEPVVPTAVTLPQGYIPLNSFISGNIQKLPQVNVATSSIGQQQSVGKSQNFTPSMLTQQAVRQPQTVTVSNPGEVPLLQQYSFYSLPNTRSGDLLGHNQKPVTANSEGKALSTQPQTSMPINFQNIGVKSAAYIDVKKMKIGTTRPDENRQNIASRKTMNISLSTSTNVSSSTIGNITSSGITENVFKSNTGHTMMGSTVNALLSNSGNILLGNTGSALPSSTGNQIYGNIPLISNIGGVNFVLGNQHPLQNQIGSMASNMNNIGQLMIPMQFVQLQPNTSAQQTQLITPINSNALPTMSQNNIATGHVISNCPVTSRTLSSSSTFQRQNLVQSQLNVISGNSLDMQTLTSTNKPKENIQAIKKVYQDNILTDKTHPILSRPIPPVFIDSNPAVSIEQMTKPIGKGVRIKNTSKSSSTTFVASQKYTKTTCTLRDTILAGNSRDDAIADAHPILQQSLQHNVQSVESGDSKRNKRKPQMVVRIDPEVIVVDDDTPPSHIKEPTIPKATPSSHIKEQIISGDTSVCTPSIIEKGIRLPPHIANQLKRQIGTDVQRKQASVELQVQKLVNKIKQISDSNEHS